MLCRRMTRLPHPGPSPNPFLSIHCQFQHHRTRMWRASTALRHDPHRLSYSGASANDLGSFQSSPPAVKFPELSYPSPHILLVTLNRPESLNCVNTDGHYELESLFQWYDNEPSLRCAVVTGAGRAFVGSLALYITSVCHSPTEDTSAQSRTCPYPALHLPLLHWFKKS